MFLLVLFDIEIVFFFGDSLFRGFCNAKLGCVRLGTVWIVPFCKVWSMVHIRESGSFIGDVVEVNAGIC